MIKEEILKKQFDDWTDEEIEVMKKDEDCCSKCGFPLDDEDFEGQNEDRGECHGAIAYEYVIYGYKCSNCGYHENF
jgi:hypothetical protein